MKHYIYGGSSAARQIACPSWLTHAEHIPKGGGGSSYADEGTVLHYCMQQILENDLIPNTFLDTQVTTEGIKMTITEAHVELIEMALAAFDEMCRALKVQYYKTEQTHEIDKETGGTSDVEAWNDANVLALVDWKFGQGVAVSPVENKQSMFYHMSRDAHVKPNRNFQRWAVIIQPMPSRDVDTLKMWEIPDKYYETFKRDYLNSRGATGTHAGDHCQFCPAQPVCPIKSGAAHQILKMVDASTITELSNNLQVVDGLRNWCAVVENLAHEQMEQGIKIDGFKLVHKRATRKWDGAAYGTPATYIEEKLRKIRKLKIADVLDTKLKSPTQIEKIFKKKGLDMSVLDDYIVKQSTGTTIARTEDPRDEIAVNSNELRQALERSLA